jgi:2-hydroxyacyl-CoA lyase 1
VQEISGSEMLARQLKIEQIDTVFTVFAGPMTETLGALARGGVRVIGCRHEEQAGFMAQAWGYVKKKPGVVIVGSGPAMTNTVTSLQVAQENAWPLVVFGGSVGATSRWEGPTRGWGGFQETDQVLTAAPVSKLSIGIDSSERIPEFVHLAVGKAMAGRPGSVYVDFPGHMLSAHVPSDRALWRESTPTIHSPYPDPAGIRKIAEMLAQAERPLIIIGRGAGWANASEPLQRLVDLGLPFVSSPMGRGTIPDDDIHNAGAARSASLVEADMVLAVGARFNWMFQFGRPPAFSPDVRIAQIDIEAEEFCSAADLTVGVVADCSVAVAELATELDGREIRSRATGWLNSLQERSASNRSRLNEIMASQQAPINPYRLFRDIRDCMPRDVIYSVDGEITLGIGRLILPSYLPRHRLNSGTLACMGVGVPYAIGAKLARPDRVVVAVLGDYAFGASAMEIETAARVGAAVLFIVVNNAGIAGRGPQRRTFGGDEPLVAGLLAADYEKMAEMVGGHAERVEDPARIRPAIEQALASRKVALVNVIVDPEGSARRGGGYL